MYSNEELINPDNYTMFERVDEREIDLQLKYKVRVTKDDQREKVIRNHIVKWTRSEHAHENEFYIKSKFKLCPIVNLPIDLPIYHLNNGRTQSMQSQYIFEEKENFVRKI